MNRSRFLAPSALLVAVAVSVPTTVAIADETVHDDAMFTYEAVLAELNKKSSARSDEPTVGSTLGEALTARDLGLSAIEIDGEVAIVSHSLVREDRGATASATPSFVDLAWAPMRGVHEYIISREGVRLGTTSRGAH